MEAAAVSCTVRLIVINANLMQTIRHHRKLKVHQPSSDSHKMCAFTLHTESDIVYRNMTSI